ncbi:MAG: hypothetical protein ACRCX2_30175 [Paraclostridium sp.]
METKTFIESLIQLGAIGAVAAICLKNVLDDKKDDKLLFRETIQSLTTEMKEDRELYRDSLKSILHNLSELSKSSHLMNSQIMFNMEQLNDQCSENAKILKKIGEKDGMDI